MIAVWQNLGMSTLALLTCLIPLWILSLRIKNASIIDIFWGPGFAVVALTCLYLAPYLSLYLKILAALPVVWAIRLGLYLAKRNIGHGEDYRYVAMQRRAKKQGISETKWRLRSFVTIFLGQGFLILIVSAPIWYGLGKGLYTDPNSVMVDTTPGVLTVIGVGVWLVGFLFEAIGDWQLSRFLKRSANYDGPYEQKPVLNKGLWKYTRHPNYFGNALIWWGIFIVACQVPGGWMTIFAPIVMTVLLVRVSGKALLERKMKKRPEYAKYVNSTSGFIPWPPKKSR